MALAFGVNASLMRLNLNYSEGYDLYLTDDALREEHDRLEMFLRRHRYIVAGNATSIPLPAWGFLLQDAPYFNRVHGRWLLAVALEALGLMGDTENIFWVVLQASQVMVSGRVNGSTLDICFQVPKNVELASDTCFFLRHYVSQHLTYDPDWPEEAEFDILDACHDLSDGAPPPTRTKNGLALSEIQRSTIEWLHSRLGLDGTLEALFVPYVVGPNNNRLYYCDELRCLTTSRWAWSRRVVLLADNAAGKDTAVLTYLSRLHVVRNLVMIVCAERVVEIQWRRKLAAHQLAGVVVTYSDVCQPDFAWPRVHVLILDSAVDFRHVIMAHVDFEQHPRIVMLSSYIPSCSTVWRLLSPHSDPCATVWMKSLHGPFTNELWNTCVLTHSECVKPFRYHWTRHELPMLQPVLYRQWQQENLGFLSQLIDPDGSNVSSVLRVTARRMQQALMGFVEAPEVHYNSRPSNVSCSICLEPHAIIPVQTGCRHTFCFVCMQQWRLRNDSCPLCRQDVYPVAMLPVPARMLSKSRIPFVQKQLALRDLLLRYGKIIVVSRFDMVLHTLARIWTAHDTFYGNNDVDAFNAAARGVWFVPHVTLTSNLDLTTFVDAVVFLEKYPDHHQCLQMAQRLFSFAMVMPALYMLSCAVDVENVVPEESNVFDLVSVLH